MRVDRRFLGWGVFFILLGGIPLAVAQGWIPDDLPWWQLWPIVLIGIGVTLVLRHTPARPIGTIIVAGTVGAILGGTLASGVVGAPVIGLGCAGASGSAFTTQQGQLAGSTADVTLELGCGDLSVHGGSGTGWTIDGTSDGGRVPRVDASTDRLTVRDEQQVAFFGARSTWDVTLPDQPSIGLSTTVSAGSSTLDLSGLTIDGLSVTMNAGSTTISAVETAQLRSLSMTVNAGKATISLPSRSMTGSLTANAGSITMCVDLSSVGLRISTNSNLTAGNDFDEAGLTEVSSDVWESPGYATAAERIELSASANAGSLSLQTEGACGG